MLINLINITWWKKFQCTCSLFQYIGVLIGDVIFDRMVVTLPWYRRSTWQTFSGSIAQRMSQPIVSIWRGTDTSTGVEPQESLLRCELWIDWGPRRRKGHDKELRCSLRRIQTVIALLRWHPNALLKPQCLHLWKSFSLVSCTLQLEFGGES